jgi:drug/metabolite transporter (DMT)-like permease
MDGSESRTITNGVLGSVVRVAMSPYTMAAVSMLLWAGSNIVVRGVREEVPPMGLSFWRTFLGFLIVLPFVLPRLPAYAPIIRANWRIISLVSFLLIVGGNALLFLSLQFTIVINVALLNSVEPILIIIVAWIAFRDPLSRRQAAGVAVSLLGVVVLVSRGDLETIAKLDFNSGDILVFFAYVSWACYAVYMRLAPRQIDHLTMLALLLGVGAAMLAPIYLVEHFAFRPTVFSWEMIASAAGLALFTSVLGVLSWNRALAALGSNRAGLFIHLIAVYSVILSIVFLGERLEEFHVTGILLIGIGIYFANTRREPRIGGDARH